jgi:hypothetical protein
MDSVSLPLKNKLKGKKMVDETQSGTTPETPGMIKIEVNSPKTDRSVEFERNFGATLEEAASLFGSGVVLSVFIAQATIRAQGAARSVLDKEENGGEAARAAGLAYTPGVVRRKVVEKVDPEVMLKKAVAKGELSHAQLVAMLQAAIEREGAADDPGEDVE